MRYAARETARGRGELRLVEGQVEGHLLEPVELTGRRSKEVSLPSLPLWVERARGDELRFELGLVALLGRPGVSLLTAWGINNATLFIWSTSIWVTVRSWGYLTPPSTRRSIQPASFLKMVGESERVKFGDLWLARRTGAEL